MFLGRQCIKGISKGHVLIGTPAIKGKRQNSYSVINCPSNPCQPQMYIGILFWVYGLEKSASVDNHSKGVASKCDFMVFICSAYSVTWIRSCNISMPFRFLTFNACASDYMQNIWKLFIVEDASHKNRFDLWIKDLAADNQKNRKCEFSFDKKPIVKQLSNDGCISPGLNTCFCWTVLHQKWSRKCAIYVVRCRGCQFY